MNGRSIVAPLVKFLIFVLVTVLATGVLITTIADSNMRSADSYTARFTDVTSLNEGDDVRISGVKVGEVEAIDVTDRRLAEVRFNVSQRQLPESVRVIVKYRNLVGQRYLALEPGAGDTTDVMEVGSTIPLQQTKPALDLTQLLGGFKPLFQALSPKDVNQLSHEIIQVLQGEGGTVESLLSHTASLTSTVAAKDKVIGEVINNLNGVLDTVNGRSKELSGTIVQLQQVVSGLAADREPIGEAIEAMDGLTHTTADLVGEARPALREDIVALGDLSQNLNDHETVVEDFLKTFPGKVEKLARTASHGSWFNFYLCGASGTVGVGDLNVPLPLMPTTQPRCQP